MKKYKISRAEVISYLIFISILVILWGGISILVILWGGLHNTFNMIQEKIVVGAIMGLIIILGVYIDLKMLKREK